MPLLRNGHWVDNNPWIRVDDDIESLLTVRSEKPMLCSLKHFLELQKTVNNAISGVWLKPDDDVTQLAEHLHHLQIVVIDFPVYTDGRGYSQARQLRKQLGFSGELRASGDVRPDQILFMARAGINAFDFDEPVDKHLIKKTLERFTVNYQPSYTLPIAG